MIAPLILGPDVLFPTKDSVEIRLDGDLLMRLTAKGAENIARDVKVEFVEEPAQPLFLGYPHGPKDAQFVPPGAKRKTLVVRFAGHAAGVQAEIAASSDSLPCSDSPDAILASSFNNAASTQANGVYDRAGDWLLTNSATQGVQPIGRGKYRLAIGAGSSTFTLRTDYYRNHLGYFLWDKSQPLWRRPVAGWCSWMAHLQDVEESHVRAAAKFFSENLKAYGYDVIQIDDGFQRVKQHSDEPLAEPFADYWTKPNPKFPSGLRILAADISKLGMTPGIWVGYYLPQTLKTKEGYVTDAEGKPHKGDWVGYSMNALVPEAREEAYLATVKQLRRDGWRYFKIDTLRHVLYDSYRKVPGYWRARNESMEIAFRTLLSETKRAVGRDTYLLACWGTMPELAGIADGARIGEDVGPDVASMRRSAKYIAQFHNLNNVVWRNDPDYMCLRVPAAVARTWATLCALAGGHIMVSDPVAAYDRERVEILSRVGPPLFLRPANAVAMPVDPEFMALHARKFGENWSVVSRFGWGPRSERSVPLEEIGLDPKQTYLAFDFWQSNFLGEVKGSASFANLGDGDCQVLCFRPALDRPQVLGTDRHIGQGAHELEDVRWQQGLLSGKFRPAPDRPWHLFVRVPTGWALSASTAATEQDGEMLKVSIPAGDQLVDWRLRFVKRGG